MKAYIMDKSRILRIADVGEPAKHADNILVKIRAASICGTDMRTFLKGSMKIDAPRVLGHEFAGDIIHVGEELKDYGFDIGDRVTAAPAIGCGECCYCKEGYTNMCENLETIGFQYDGVFASVVEIPAKAVKNGNLLHLPDSISYDDATLIEPAACAWNGQTYLQIHGGDVVLIYGSGMIGCIHSELAYRKGASQVIIVEPVEKRGKIAMEKVPGIIWINPFTQNTVEEVRKLTAGRGADVVITATSVPSVHEEAQKAAAKRGRISLFGGLPGDGKGYLDSNLIHYKELQIFGVHATTPRYMKDIMKIMEDGELDAQKYIEKTVALEDVEKGFCSIRDDNTMKVVIHP